MAVFLADDPSDVAPVPDDAPRNPNTEAWLILLPLLIVLFTFIILLLLFLLCVVVIRRRRGIALRDADGPVDLGREEFIGGEGGLDGVESRWLETVDESERRSYARAKEYQSQYPPNSFPTDITLSQFLSIQEKGVSAWCFEPDYETVNSLLVHTRTEITFLPDPASSSCVQSNLPLPKLNEVYYWEVKMFDLPVNTKVAVGLATKPYPTFRLPGLNRFSVAYHSSGDKSHNYPFTTTTYGSPLKEGDVLGVGYRPRSGTVFFTRNGRKMEDAFTGLNRWNLFPTIGADGPCSVHVNLGQAGFVFIEANVKKWGLAPSVGTLAPPPAYGSERGSILLDVGGRNRADDGTPQSVGSTSSRRSRRERRHRAHNSGEPVVSSPLRTQAPLTPPPPITPIDEEPSSPVSGRYISPTDLPFHTPPNLNLPRSPRRPRENVESDSGTELSSGDDDPTGANPFSTPRRITPSLAHIAASLTDTGRASTSNTFAHHHQQHLHRPPPESPMTPDPPTPNLRDIHLQSLHSRNGSRSSNHHHESEPSDTLSGGSSLSRRDPPAYSPLDAYTYADGVQLDLPAEVIAAALDRGGPPESAVGSSSAGPVTRR